MRKSLRPLAFSILLFASLVFQGCATAPAEHSRHRGLFAVLSDGRSDREADLAEKDASDEDSRESGAPGATLAEEPVKNGSTQFNWPLKQLQVTSPFGKRPRDFHEGVDLRARSGTPIFAARSGVVIYAGAKIRGYGRMIVIKHSGGYATVYAHASRLLVRRGQQVRVGQRIAFSGQSGRADGPHLHFEIRKGVVAMNPMNYLPVRAARAARPTRTLASLKSSSSGHARDRKTRAKIRSTQTD